MSDIAVVTIFIDNIDKWKELKSIPDYEKRLYIENSINECIRNDFQMKDVQITVKIETVIR